MDNVEVAVLAHALAEVVNGISQAAASVICEAAASTMLKFGEVRAALKDTPVNSKQCAILGEQWQELDDELKKEQIQVTGIDKESLETLGDEITAFTGQFAYYESKTSITGRMGTMWNFKTDQAKMVEFSKRTTDLSNRLLPTIKNDASVLENFEQAHMEDIETIHKAQNLGQAGHQAPLGQEHLFGLLKGLPTEEAHEMQRHNSAYLKSDHVKNIKARVKRGAESLGILHVSGCTRIWPRECQREKVMLYTEGGMILCLYVREIQSKRERVRERERH